MVEVNFRLRKVMLNNLGLSQKSYEHVFGSDEKLDKQFSQARLLLYTSLYEGFGLPVFRVSILIALLLLRIVHH